MITDGREIYIRGAGDAWERTIDGQLTFAFVIELSQIQKEVANGLTAVELATHLAAA